MRVAIIILSCFTGLVIHDYTVIPVRLSAFVKSDERPLEVMGSLILFVLWTAATALVYAYPAVARWLFALAGGVGFYVGITYGIEEFTIWGLVAVSLAAFTSVACREKQAADHVAWARAQHELAVYTALRSLDQTVPELLSRVPEADERHPGLGRLVELRPAKDAVLELVRR